MIWILFILVSFWGYRLIKNKPFQLIPHIGSTPHTDIVYTFTEKEIDYYKRQIFNLINDQQYNQSKILINKLYHANISLEDKKLFKTWEIRLTFPKIDSLDKEISINNAQKKPFLYEGCFVLWKGKASSITQKNNYLYFSLNFDNKQISVIYLSNYPLNENDVIEVFGKLNMKDDKLELEAFKIEKK